MLVRMLHTEHPRASQSLLRMGPVPHYIIHRNDTFQFPTLAEISILKATVRDHFEPVPGNHRPASEL